MNEAQEKESDPEIRIISAAETVPLRHALLRPGRTLAAANFPGDDEAATRHFGAFLADELVGIVTLLRAPFPEHPQYSAVQLRGMATTPEVRGKGHGRALVLKSIDFAREVRAEVLWCNARVVALGFYQKLGFEIIGREFQVPEVGPHFRMWRRITDAD